MTNTAWWFIAAAILLGLELISFSIFIFAPLAGAAVITGIAAALGAGIEVQLAVFGILAISSMFLLYPIAKRHRNTPREFKNNAEALVGLKARVLDRIDRDTPGLVRLENENWTAVPADGVTEILPDVHVRVVEIRGAAAVVTPWEDEA